MDHPNVKFHYVINCAAITDTTKIELDQSTRDLSYKVNVLGPKHLAEVCLASRSKLIHISTDYVFSELSKSNEEFPINEYGIHKLLGEKMVECTFGSRSQDFMILRTSWLYGGSSSSFPIKLLKNCIKASRLESKQVKVVDDCYGRPTSVQYLSKFIIVAIKHQAYGKIDAQASYAITRHEFADTVKSTV